MFSKVIVRNLKDIGTCSLIVYGIEIPMDRVYNIKAKGTCRKYYSPVSGFGGSLYIYDFFHKKLRVRMGF